MGKCLLGLLQFFSFIFEFDGSVGNEPTSNAGDTGDMSSIPGSGTSPGEGNDNPLQYSCWENPMDQGILWATVQRVTKSPTRLMTKHSHIYLYESVGLNTSELLKEISVEM